jgi:Protein of unknown function (DUF1524)
MNNRGKPLSKLELLKNRLIYLSTLLPENTDQQQALRRNINDAWRTIYQFLGKESKRPLPDDDFLRAHWIIYFTYARDEAQQYSSFLLEEHFTPDRVTAKALNGEEIQKYVDSIQNASKAWYAIHFPDRADNVHGEIRTGLESLNRLGVGAFAPLMMASLLISVDTPTTVRLLGEAERFIFLVGRICQRRADTGDAEFYRLAGHLYRRNQTIVQATEVILERTKQHFSLEKAQVEMRELFDNGSGFYDWAGLKYFLYEYEQSLQDLAGMQTPKIAWHDFARTRKDQITIEHIFPASPKTGEWPTFESYLRDDQHYLRHSLGNLLALSQSRNSRLSNRPFQRKRQDADGVRGYFNGSYSEIAVAQEQDWTPKQVLDRGLTMLNFLQRRWCIDLGLREHRVWLLRLECVDRTAKPFNLLEYLLAKAGEIETVKAQ